MITKTIALELQLNLKKHRQKDPKSVGYTLVTIKYQVVDITIPYVHKIGN